MIKINDEQTSPWLHPSVMEAQPYMAGYYRDALKAQLRRHGLFLE